MVIVGLVYALVVNRYRFSLKAFLIVTTSLAVWLGLKIGRDSRLEQAIRIVSDVGGQLKFHDSSPDFPWQVPEICQRIASITDGFWLFGKEIWDGFKFWGSHDYQQLPVWLIEQALAERLFPIAGQVPDLVSISAANGAVLASDWEVHHQPEHGWGKIIAPTLHEYIRTLIHVREAYGYDDDCPSDWWRPYADFGTRYDLEQ